MVRGRQHRTLYRSMTSVDWTWYRSQRLNDIKKTQVLLGHWTCGDIIPARKLVLLDQPWSTSLTWLGQRWLLYTYVQRVCVFQSQNLSKMSSLNSYKLGVSLGTAEQTTTGSMSQTWPSSSTSTCNSSSAKPSEGRDERTDERRRGDRT